MARGISITPLNDIFAKDIQQLEGMIGYSFYDFINQFKTGSAINTGAIVSTTIGGSAVIAAKIAGGAVTVTKLGDGAVTTAKIDDGAIHKAGYWVEYGCAVGVNGGSNASTVTVAAGAINAGGAWAAVANGSAAGAGVSAVTMIVYAAAGGTVAVVTGSTGLPATGVALAYINNATAASVTAAEIDNGARFQLAKY